MMGEKLKTKTLMQCWKKFWLCLSPCYHLQNFMIEFRQPLLNTHVPFSMAEIIPTMERKLFHQKILETILITCQKHGWLFVWLFGFIMSRKQFKFPHVSTKILQKLLSTEIKITWSQTSYIIEQTPLSLIYSFKI